MSVLDAMVDALTEAVESAAELTQPRGVVVFISDVAPGKIPTNDSLSILGKVRAALDEGFQPVVVFARSNPADKYGRSAILKAIKEMATDSNGRVRVVVRGIARTEQEEGDFALWSQEIESDKPAQKDFDEWEREIVPNESLLAAVSRAGAGLELPVAGVVVGFPIGGRESTAQLPHALRKFFRQFDLTVVADYSHGAVREGNHSAIEGRSGTVSDLEQDVQALLNYTSVAAPTAKIREKLAAATERHLKNTDGYSYTEAYPLINEDGELSIATAPIAGARSITTGMSPELRAEQGHSLMKSLGLSPAVDSKADDFYGPTPAFTHEIGREITQSDYGLAN